MITSLIPTKINVCNSKSGSLGTMIAVTIYKIPKPVDHLNKILENGFCVHKITRTTKNKITNVSSSTTSFKNKETEYFHVMYENSAIKKTKLLIANGSSNKRQTKNNMIKFLENPFFSFFGTILKSFFCIIFPPDMYTYITQKQICFSIII